MSDQDRKLRAEERRKRIVVAKYKTGDPEPDTVPIRGVEAMSLAWQLTREAWNLSGKPWPNYTRENTPIKIVRLPSKKDAGSSK